MQIKCGQNAVISLAREFDVAVEVTEQLATDRDNVAAMLAVARNVKSAIQGSKPLAGSCFEEQRIQYHVLLAGAFGPPAKERDTHGMANKIGIKKVP